MNNLNVLYCCDDNYAPFATVSIYSLLKNNRGFDAINVYVILYNVSEKNKLLMERQINLFQAKFIPIDAEQIVQEIIELGLLQYRDSYATYFRLFFDQFVDNRVEKLLYLDCDTIVCGNLIDIIESDMEEVCIYAVQESLGDKYKNKYKQTILGMTQMEPYFNAGVLLINLQNWRKYECKAKIIQHIRTVRNEYCCHDQDLLNIVLKDHVRFLNPRYNFQPIHRLLSDRDYRIMYKVKSYYSEEELDFARKNPVILHTYRFLGEFPWHKDSRHPDTAIFNRYLKESTQREYVKKKSQVGLIIKIERVLYSLLPRKWFFVLFTCIHEWCFMIRCRMILRRK